MDRLRGAGRVEVAVRCGDEDLQVFLSPAHLPSGGLQQVKSLMEDDGVDADEATAGRGQRAQAIGVEVDPDRRRAVVIHDAHHELPDLWNWLIEHETSGERPVPRRSIVAVAYSRGVRLRPGGRLVGLLPPLLLAVLLALGLAAMHTLGHLGGHGAPPPNPATAIHAEGDHSAVPGSGHGGMPSESPDAASICLAILAALVVFAVPLLHLAGMLRARAQERPHLRWRVAGSLRGPPGALVLTRTVVLRT